MIALCCCHLSFYVSWVLYAVLCVCVSRYHARVPLCRTMENHIVLWEVVFPARTSNFTSGQIRKGHPLFSIVKFSTGHLWEDLSRHSSWSMGKQPPQFMGIFMEHFPPKGEICQIQPGGLLSRSSWNCHQCVWQLFFWKMNVLWRVKLNFVKVT